MLFADLKGSTAAIEALDRELREAGVVDRARVGLNSGEVLYRTLASDLGIEVDVVGPVSMSRCT